MYKSGLAQAYHPELGLIEAMQAHFFQKKKKKKKNDIITELKQVLAELYTRG